MKPKSLHLLLHNCGSLVNAKQIHAQSLTHGHLNAHQPSACKLVTAYARLGDPQAAHQVFHHYIPHPDLVSSTCLINLFLHTHLPCKALSAFANLLHRGLRPDSVSLVGALSACGRSIALLCGKIVHGLVFRFQLCLNTTVGNALIDMYCRNGQVGIALLVFKHMGTKDVCSWTSLLNGFVLCNDLESARHLFDQMPQRNTVAWTAMINGYVKGEMHIRALQMFKQMKAEGQDQPTAFTIVAVLSSCAHTGALHHGQAIHAYISKVRLNKDITVNNALMDVYSKTGCTQLAVKIFNGMTNRDVFSWTTMITGYAFHGKGNHAIQVFDDMLESRVIPNDVTFLSVLSACSHAGLAVEAQKLFDRMIQYYGFEPKIEHYGCMVDLLGRAGLLEEAKEFIDKMPIDPDAIIWRSLLGSCLVHGNLNLAEMAGKKIIQLEPSDDGVYVLLSNIYYHANRREDALNMRKMLGNRKFRKKPACSWVEVNSVVHEFVAEDRILASTEICLFLQSITEHWKLDFDFSSLE